MKALMPVIAFAVTFAVGGGAGAVMTRPVAADSTHADTAHADTTHAGISHGGVTTGAHAADTAAHAAGTPASVTPHAADSTAPNDAHATEPRNGGSTGTRATPESTPHAPASDGVNRGSSQIASLLRSGTGAVVSMRPDGTIGPNAAAAPAEAVPDYQRLSRLLGRMDARGAAKTLEQLPADQAARALSMMNDKTAAAILQQLAPEKSASLLLAVLTLVPKVPAP